MRNKVVNLTKEGWDGYRHSGDTTLRPSFFPPASEFEDGVQLPGADAERRDYNTFFSFTDPDGTGSTVQEVGRRPGLLNGRSHPWGDRRGPGRRFGKRRHTRMAE